jgi:hypothetical protein
VQVKWTGSKVIKYGTDAFHLHTWMSILEEMCLSFRLMLLSELSESYSADLEAAHQAWDAGQTYLRSYCQKPEVKRKQIIK